MSAFNTIALIGRYHSPDVATALVTMGEYLRRQGRAVLVEKETAVTNRVNGFSVADYDEIDAMADMLAGHHTIEERTMLAAEVRRDGVVTLATLALNDAVVNKGSVGRLIEFVVNIDGEFLYDLRADGLIVATPTG